MPHDESHPLEIHLVGLGLGHALTPAVHNFAAGSIGARGLPWRVIATECATVEDCVRLFRSPGQAGGIVTMPWKNEITKYLDRLDETATILGAVNVVFFDETGALCGSNTDWIGIEGALRAASAPAGECAVVIGAGGAARAAIYALAFRFGVKEVYVLNRDDEETTALMRDCRNMPCQLLDVKCVDQARGLKTVSSIVGCTPDMEAVTPAEEAVKNILSFFLSTQGDKGTMLDMCYHPSRETRNLRMASSHGWRTISGTQVIGHQVEALWRCWTPKTLDADGFWSVLNSAAEMDAAGRQRLNAEIIDQRFGSNT